MSQIKEIFDGFKNLIFKDDEKVEALAETRMKICFECTIRTDSKCDRDKGGCGCYIKAKIRSVGSQCPLKKW